MSGRTRTPTTPGTYYYYACVNAVQGEQDTQNNCSQTPATVTVQQETEVPPVEEPEPETPQQEPTEGPDLSITNVTATPTSVQPGDRTTLRATIVNVGAPEETKVIRFYRHTALTENPKTGGRYIGSRTTTLPTDESRTVSGRTRTPTTPGTYHYYACVNAVQGEQNTQNNCSQTPATVTVQPETEVPPVEEPEETPEPTNQA